ncbi:MAG: kelch repeat-containing protein, partial [Solirubrobacterales bacterium]|nr:kelch repeat-containing protein [Solirubrobacterales bacterium]
MPHAVRRLIPVLVVLASAAFAPVAQAGVFDVFTTTGSLTTARGGATASVLPSGKVLIAGGDGNSGRLASGELYNPATGLFTTTGSLTTARYRATASVLPSGKVLIAGGRGNSGYLASGELYDPATGLFTTTGSLTTARGR